MTRFQISSQGILLRSVLDELIYRGFIDIIPQPNF